MKQQSGGGEATEGRLAQYLRALRVAKRLTLRQVEESAGVSNAYLSQMEQGKMTQPSPHILQKLAQFYGIAYEELFEKAGYLAPRERPSRLLSAARVQSSQKGEVRLPGRRNTGKALFGDLNEQEEQELLEYLAFLRSKRK